ALHEPTRLVSADRQARKIHRPQLLTNLSKHWRVSRIAGEEYPDALDAHHESAPERPIPIERAARGEMMGRRQRNRAVRKRGLLPPIELFNPADACGLRERSIAQRRHHDGIESPGESSKRLEIAVIVMIVAEQDRGDRRQVVEANRRRPY